MAPFRYSVHMITYESAGYKTLDPKDAEKVFSSMDRLGFEGIEPMGFPERAQQLRPIIELASSYQLETPMVTGLWGRFGAMVGTYPEKDPTSTNPKRRRDAIEYLKKCADIAVMFGSTAVQACLGSLDDQDTTEKGISRARKSFIEVLQRSAPYAADRGVRLIVEPQSRYEGYYGVNTTVEMCASLIEEAGADNLVLMADSFHGNIEELSFPRAIRKHAKKLAHMHFADNNRLPPSLGAMDFKPIVRELVEMDYRGFIGLECVPIGPDPDASLAKGIRYLKAIEDSTRK